MKRSLLYFVFALISVSAASAQNDCELMYESARIYFENKEYKKAADMYRLVVNECGENYGGAGLKIKECRKLMAATKTVAYPTSIARPSEPKATATEPSAPLYTTGEERIAKKNAYMNIKSVEFYNVDENGKKIKQIGPNTYASDIKYLNCAIKYDGLIDRDRNVTIYYKIIKPNGKMLAITSSPYGYTDSEKFWVNTGTNGYYQFQKYYKDDFSGGKYLFEIWYENSLLYSTSFVLKERESIVSKEKLQTKLTKCFNFVTNRIGNDIYKGQITNSIIRNGLGIYAWTYDGIYYIGDWQSDNMNGKGIYIVAEQIPNCKKSKFYVGEISWGKKSGYGKCYDRYGNMLYNGRFINDKPVDTYPLPDKNKYDNYKFECLEYNNGDCYIGETSYGQRNGLGFYIWNNGDIWYGSWSNNNRESFGVYMQYDGTIYTGKYGVVR